MIMTGLEWSIFLSGVGVGALGARTIAHTFWRLTTGRRYKRRH